MSRLNVAAGGLGVCVEGEGRGREGKSRRRRVMCVWSVLEKKMFEVVCW